MISCCDFLASVHGAWGMCCVNLLVTILFICRDTRNVTTYLGLCGHSGFLPEDVEVPHENLTLLNPVALLHDKDLLYILQDTCVTIIKSSDDSFVVSVQRVV